MASGVDSLRLQLSFVAPIWLGMAEFHTEFFEKSEKPSVAPHLPGNSAYTPLEKIFNSVTFFFAVSALF